MSRVLVLTLLLAACGGGASDAPDAATADAGESDVELSADAEELLDAAADAEVVFDPVTPALPVLTPCPTGWREIAPSTAVEVATCEPWQTSRPACPNGMLAVPGRECVTIGDACPASGDWAVSLPNGANVRYVKAGAVGGNGSRLSPYGAIGAAAAGAPAGTIIALDGSTYREAVSLPIGVSLWGRCALQTTIYPPVGSPVAVTPRGVSTLRNLSILTTATAVSSIDATLTIEGLRLVSGGLIEVGGGSLRARHLQIPASGSGRLEVSYATAEIADSAIDGMGGAYKLGIAGATVRISDSVVRCVGCTSVIFFGDRDEVLTVTRSVFEDSAGVVIDGQTTGASVELNDAVFRRLSSSLGVVRTPVLRANRVLVVDSAGVALRAPRADLGDVVLRNVGAGLFGASASVRRLLVIGAQSGLRMVGDAGGAPPLVTLNDITARVIAGSISGSGPGLFVEHAVVSGSRLSLVATTAVALQAQGQSTVNLTEVTIRGARERLCVTSSCPQLRGIAFGLFVDGASSLDLRRFRIADNLLCGVAVAGTAQVDLHEGEVSGHAVGANIQSPNQDFRRLSDAVFYRNNAVNLDSLTLPTPPPPCDPALPACL